MADEAHETPERGCVEADERIAWMPSGRLELAAYIAVGVGYLLAVLTARRLGVPGFLLLTCCSLCWLALFQLLMREETTQRQNLLIALGMCGLSVVTSLGIFIGLGLDWLLPVVTISVLAVLYPVRKAIVICLPLYLSMVIPLAFADSPFGTKTVADDQIQLAAAFAFAFLFSVVMRQQQVQRARAEALVAEIEEAHQKLRAYADQVEELTITRERNRMAREIHDTLGHYLTLLAVQLETALKLEARGDHGLHAELVEARRVASECLSEVRRSVAALRPADPTSLSFRDALARLVAEFQMAAPEAEVALDVEGPAQSLAPEQRVALYRSAQEALTNIRKHAGASKVLVRLRANDEAAELTVLDNGVGAGAAAGGAVEDAEAPGFGLLGMRERVALLGGTATAGPEPGRGWRVEVRVPLTSAALVASH